MIDWLTSLTPGGFITAVAAAVAAISTFVQISPIKLNPWSWLAKKIGKAINGEVMDKVDKLEQDIRNMQEMQDERAAKSARTRVLRFGDEILHGTKHSKEHFDNILLDIKEYNDYCDSHEHFKNDVMHLTSQLVKDTYRRCMEEHSFI